MLDLGTSFIASVARDPNALAIVDGDVRLTYRAWYGRISAGRGASTSSGCKPGDHIVSVLQNRWEAATLHWACQFAGIVITPLNWRAKADELDYCIENAEAKALVYEAVATDAVQASQAAPARCRGSPRSAGVARPSVRVASSPHGRGRRAAGRRRSHLGDALYIGHHRAAEGRAAPPSRRARRGDRPCRAEPLPLGERTLGVMPLYHTMGVRSLLAMSLIGGAFVCLPRFDVGAALDLIAAEKITNLYLVPTLYHDLLHHERFKRRTSAPCASSALPALR